MDSYTTITVDAGQTTTITLNRPDRLNALTVEMLEELHDALQKIATGDIAARALLITGAGRGFCAGADLVSSGRRETGMMLMRQYHPVALELSNLNIPVVSAINGVAAGAGMSLALNADFVIAGSSASFLQAFVNIGLVPDMGSSYWLPRLIGPQRARQMMMLGEQIPADQAADWGLVYKTVADDALMAEAVALATKLSEGPTQSYGGIRALMRGTYSNSYETQLQLEAMTQRRCQTTEDSVEGVAAFVEKRAAKFKGR